MTIISEGILVTNFGEDTYHIFGQDELIGLHTQLDGVITQIKTYLRYILRKNQTKTILPTGPAKYFKQISQLIKGNVDRKMNSYDFFIKVSEYETRYLTGIEQKKICDATVESAIAKTGQTTKCLNIVQTFKFILNYARRLSDDTIMDVSVTGKYDLDTTGNTRRLQNGILIFSVKTNDVKELIRYYKCGAEDKNDGFEDTGTISGTDDIRDRIGEKDSFNDVSFKCIHERNMIPYVYFSNCLISGDK